MIENNFADPGLKGRYSRFGKWVMTGLGKNPYKGRNNDPEQIAQFVDAFMGDADTFYLDGATVLLKESLEQLGSDAVVEIHPGKDHGSLMTAELRNRIRREMVDAFLAGRSR